ncbi:DUF1801 domain-containing protein [Marivirga salinae]|uniref:DUF1801 domain-containing protein n=1 Tax=Marivirga salinarum TaxID=3059078 RepID=A0AA51NBI9_9BACT|nr:DUF1801 domain-containing protein [Marivirga sp. BDSF4-3]WMN11975.1 DUF1801 domain-containing protein [Marivirga sp. BDSF4-3]
MQFNVKTVQEYIEAIPVERKPIIQKFRKTILDNLPKGFEEEMSYGMIGYVVPHSLYPSGYHVNPDLPLPFISIASQKNNIALYHMGIYSDSELLEWFKNEYQKTVSTKLDMGKSCIRFKNPKNIPFTLIGELCKKMSPQEWIGLYEKSK